MKCETPSKNLPDRPHLIIVPVPLHTQWMRELHRFLQYGGFDVMPYTHGYNAETRGLFWKQVNEARAGLPQCRRIVLASTAVSLAPCYVTSNFSNSTLHRLWNRMACTTTSSRTLSRPFLLRWTTAVPSGQRPRRPSLSRGRGRSLPWTRRPSSATPSERTWLPGSCSRSRMLVSR